MATKKIILTKEERNNLISNNTSWIEREDINNVPMSSIIYGVGINEMFDKIDYRWVYGDTKQYIKDKKNVGRRAVDYKNNGTTITNGKVTNTIT